MAPGAITRRVALAFLVASVPGGCAEGPVTRPPDPPTIETATDDSFSETVRAAERQARDDVIDQLASRFGRDLRILPRGIDSDAEPGPIKAYYEKALAGGRSWKEFPLAESGSVWSFAFTSPDGRSVLALLALNPRFAPEGGGRVPLSIITNLDDAAR